NLKNPRLKSTAELSAFREDKIIWLLLLYIQDGGTTRKTAA
ncbi:hypothetical protein LCGC14_2674930, partial [marine sediment metagenome]